MNRASFASTLLPLLPLLAACSGVTADHSGASAPVAKRERHWMSAPYLMVPAPVVLSRSEVYDAPAGPVHAPSSFDYSHPEEESPFDVWARAKRLSAKTSLESDSPPASRQSARGRPPKLATTWGEQPNAKDAAEREPPAPRLATTWGEEATAADAEKRPRATAGPVHIVWLPDYCEEYATSDSSGLTVQSPDPGLLRGLGLDSLGATFEGSGAAVAPDSSDERAGTEAAKGPTAKPRGRSGAMVTVTTTVLPLGVYPLFKRANEDCSNPLRFAFDPGTLSQRVVERKPAP